jgi:hypothetical protein
MKLMQIRKNFTADELGCVLKNPFNLPSMATAVEEMIGNAMLKAEKKDGHSQKFPESRGANYGAAAVDPESWRIKVNQLVDALEGKPPQSRFELGEALGCSKETAVKRAMSAIDDGRVCKVEAKGYSKHNPIYYFALTAAQAVAAE